MEEILRRLVDRNEIHDVLMRYCRGVDRCDESILKSVYHHDSYDDHGYWRGNGHEFASFVAKRLMAANLSTTHSVTNVLIDIDGDSARSESQVMVTLVRRGEPTVVDLMGARYLDKLTRRDGVWRIAERTVVLDWHKCEQWQDGDSPMPLDDFRRGGRGSDDPLYDFLDLKDD
ncbi:nuclear transport factor 2 family protein [Rhodococcus sp. USK10]|uniref:Gamma-BHC dehydrochlorinase n=1 Tax=Rhodococcus wratislaviensis TaxID=44752 RepID=A0A402CC21_RHOWR|nr:MULTISPECIES: nuclear transport factor 2 family protein [Rhodococcus]QYB02140.1 nuclear transport factor 2 family protein [Rhodococcus sp. USK10]GCE41164.1 Gamma-BHC dehydrochlorinase [Rhodococcus wratislaviensis]